MALRNTIVVLLLNVFLCFHKGSAQTLPVEEQIALDDLTATLGLQNGLSCSSTGITCGYTFTDYHVEVINLPQSNQNGCSESKLNSTFYNLQYLTTLNLASNCLWIGDLSVVINGSNLQTLDLSGNYFMENEPTPDEFWASMTQLQNLNLFYASLKTFPKIDSLVNLKTLNLANNNFNCEIPNFIGALSSLETLDISNSWLFGQLPDSIGNLTSLTYLNLANNALNGSLPDTVGSLTNLEDLNLVTNYLSGDIPASISNLYQLITIHLSRNEFSGPFPDLGNMISLTTLFMDDNQISGPVSSSICNCVSLKYINLAANQLTAWPTCWTQLSELATLDLSVNQISSSIPSDFSQLTKLTLFSAGGNNFYGSLPNSLWELSNLQYLLLQVNDLSGSFPTSIPAFSKLYQIDLRENSFTGSVPKALVEHSGLRYLDLSRNQLSGDLNALNFSKSGLALLDLSYNQITGQVPASVTDAPKLQHLGLSFNGLTGKMPSGFEKLAGKMSTLLLDGNTGLRGSIVTVLNSLFPYNFGGRVNLTQTGLCCPVTTSSYPYAVFAPECYETCTTTGRYGPDCSCDVPRQVEGGLCSNSTYRVSCDIDVVVAANTTIAVGGGGLVIVGNFHNDGGSVSTTTGGGSLNTGGGSSTGSSTTGGGSTFGTIFVTGNVTVNNATLVIDVTNSTVDDGTEIPVIVFNGTFSGSGFTDVEVNGGDDECSQTQGQQNVNSTSLVVTMSVDELKCDDQLSTGIITAISVCIGAALVAGIAGVVFFKQRHNRRLTKLRKTFSNHHQGADVGMQVVNPSPLGSVSAAVV